MVEYELLRQGPTQAGLSYPKYDMWVRVANPEGVILTEGAMVVSAVDKAKFMVRDFFDADSIRDGVKIEDSFPAVLLGKIRGFTKK